MGKLPADATSFIMHTRAATHGSPKDNNNNHPVISPQGTIRLVHNGIIYNHEDVRKVLGEVGEGLPEVDSSVIPAMIETFGLSSTEHIAGQAACAWFDEDTGDTIHIAKFHSNPIAYAWLADGSFVFASTPDILGRALDKAGVAWFGVYPGPFDQFREGDYIQVQGGNILSEGEVDWDDKYSYYGRNYSAQTSGGKSTYVGGTVSRKPQDEDDAPMVMGTPAEEDDDSPRQGDLVFSSVNGRSVNYGDPSQWPDPSTVSDEDFDYWMMNGHLPGELVIPRSDEVIEDADVVDESNWIDEDAAFMEGQTFTFYTIEHGGDYNEFKTLAGTVQSLSWLSGLTEAGEGIVGPDEGKIKWVNMVQDVGILDDEGKQLSWVADRNSYEKFDMIAPSWVREGLDKLRLLVVG